MEFKSNKHQGKNKRPSFSDAPPPHSQSETAHLATEDKEWDDLLSKVEEDQNRKKRKFSPFSKKTSAYDELPEEDLRKVEVNIKLSLPKMDVARFKWLKKLTSPFTKLFARVKKIRPTRRNIAIGASALILIVAGIVVGNKYLFNDKNKGAEVAGASNSNTQASREKVFEGVTPEFPILYPGSKDKDSVGKIIKNSPPNNPPVYVYVDKIGEAAVQVSQQQLPDRFKENQDGELQKLAESFQATKTIQVDSIKVFQGQTESGVQSLIFIKGNLLLLVAASQPVSDEVWVAYISSLHS